MDTKPESFSDGLRALADVLDQHPEIATLFERHGSTLGRNLTVFAHERDQWDALLATLGAEQVDPLTAERRFGPLRVRVAAIRAEAPPVPRWKAAS